MNVDESRVESGRIEMSHRWRKVAGSGKSICGLFYFWSSGGGLVMICFTESVQ